MTPQQTDQEAEKAIAGYAKALGLTTPEELQQAMEKLISKAARGIEKYCGTDVATETLTKTAEYIAKTAPNGTTH